MTTTYIATKKTQETKVLGLCAISHLMLIAGGVYSFHKDEPVECQAL